MAVIPTSLKLITSAFRRAEELEKDTSSSDNAVVSYYCRYYAVSKGSKLCSAPPTSAETQFLLGQMDILEKLKKQISVTNDKAKEICLNFAEAVFNKADDVDRMGAADKSIAKMFYAAGTFYEILEQFGEMNDELQNKKRYAKWKATDILNAIRSGTKPTAGGFAENISSLTISEGKEEENEESNDDSHLSKNDAVASTQPLSSINSTFLPPPVAPHQSQTTTASTNVYTGNAETTFPVPNSVTTASKAQQYYAVPPPSYSTSPANNTDPRVKDAIELLYFSISSLKKSDISGAKQKISEAMRRLD